MDSRRRHVAPTTVVPTALTHEKTSSNNDDALQRRRTIQSIRSRRGSRQSQRRSLRLYVQTSSIIPCFKSHSTCVLENRDAVQAWPLGVSSYQVVGCCCIGWEDRQHLLMKSGWSQHAHLAWKCMRFFPSPGPGPFGGRQTASPGHPRSPRSLISCAVQAQFCR